MLISRYLGYTLSLPGSIVANRGFIAQFGTVYVNGQLQLDAQYVGLWNAINFVSQVIFQMISPFSADRFGLKFNLYTFSFFILLVSHFRSPSADRRPSLSRSWP